MCVCPVLRSLCPKILFRVCCSLRSGCPKIWESSDVDLPLDHVWEVQNSGEFWCGSAAHSGVGGIS